MPYLLPLDLTGLHRQSLRTLLLMQLFGGPVCCPALIKKPPQRVLEIGCGSGFWSMMCHEYYKSRGYGGISLTGVDIVPLGLGRTNAAAESTKPGGTLEIRESDHHIRMLRPHVHATMLISDTGEQGMAARLGAYVMSANTPLSAHINPFLIDYNNWLSQTLEARELSAVPCTLVGPTLLQEADTLVDTRSRRFAIPLGQVRWGRDEAGTVDFRNGHSGDESEGETTASTKIGRASLSAGQKALRASALSTVVQQVQALEPALREVNGKSQDEWDVWMDKMLNDLMGNGANWGECLEDGAWWATKKMD